MLINKSASSSLVKNFILAFLFVNYIIKGEKMERENIIEEINKIILRDNCDVLSWSDVCKYTDFDSIVTALAYGVNWEKDIYKISDGALKMVLFNITNFPFGSRIPEKLIKKGSL